jgi:hypothetical protein
VQEMRAAWQMRLWQHRKASPEHRGTGGQVLAALAGVRRSAFGLRCPRLFWVPHLALRPGGLSRRRFRKTAKVSAKARVIAAVSSVKTACVAVADGVAEVQARASRSPALMGLRGTSEGQTQWPSRGSGGMWRSGSCGGLFATGPSRQPRTPPRSSEAISKIRVKGRSAGPPVSSGVARRSLPVAHSAEA